MRHKSCRYGVIPILDYIAPPSALQAAERRTWGHAKDWHGRKGSRGPFIRELVTLATVRRLYLMLLILVVPAGSVIVALSRPSTSPSPRFGSVASLVSAIVGSPRVWTGRTVLVRAIAIAQYPGIDCNIGESSCGQAQVYLADHVDGAGTSIWIKPTSLPPFVAILRRLPLIDQLLPRAPALRFDEPSVYPITLSVGVCHPCLYGLYWQGIVSGVSW